MRYTFQFFGQDLKHVSIFLTEYNSKKLFFTNKINQRAGEQQKNSERSIQNAELIEVPSMVVVLEVCFEASFLSNVIEFSADSFSSPSCKGRENC